MEDFYLKYIDEMTHEERSIFFYRYIFKLSNEESAKRLKLPVVLVRVKSSLINPELANCKKLVLEAFGI